MPYANINSARIYYEVHGSKDPIVLMQGFAKSLEGLRPVADDLKEQHTVIMLDHRGSGRSQSTDTPYTMRMLADDVLSLLTFLGIDKVSLFGHSMGGALALELCTHTPSRIQKAIICSSFAKVPYTSMMQIDTILTMMQEGIAKEIIYRTVLPWLFSSSLLSRPGSVEHILQMMLKDPYPQLPQGFLGQAHAIKTFDITESLSKITADCLILVGEDDLYTPVSCSKVLHNGIKKALMEVIPHQGHMVNEEMPQLISQKVLNFLNN
jgi:3-oxoadipate enol-lactonase